MDIDLARRMAGLRGMAEPEEVAAALRLPRVRRGPFDHRLHLHHRQRAHRQLEDLTVVAELESAPHELVPGGIQLGSRFSMNANIPSRISAEPASAPNIVWVSMKP